MDDCKHDETIVVDETMYCAQCDAPVAVLCQSCWGQGFVEENEYYCDWINYGDDLITCPNCSGESWDYS